VVLYCAADQNVAEPIIAEFEKQTGIKVLARFDSEASKTVGLVQKIRSEAAAPVADVYWSGEPFYTVRLAEEGLLDHYESKLMANWPAHLADAQGRWYGFALRARVIGYNTQRVPAAEAPRRLEDLLDAKWKGRLVMARPEFGTTGGDIASWFAHYGRERGIEILKALKANELRLVDSNSSAVRQVATGQADVCLTDSDDVYAGKRNGWPVAMNYLDRGGAGILVIPNTVALIQGGPHPETARQMVAFLLSEQVERLLAWSDAHNTPVHAALTEEFSQYTLPARLNESYEKIAQHLPDAVQMAGGILH
jgi:iron(III) transport system substrate-binding protein